MLFRVLFVLVAVAVLSACGGGSEPGATAPEAATTEAADPREGYFTSAESEALNPLLARFNDAWNEYGDDCDAEAQRLFEEGASPRRAVRCHLEANREILAATAEIGTALEGLGGDYHDACEAGIERYAAALDEAEDARRRVLQGYERYAKTGAVAGDFDERGKRAGELGQALMGEELVTLTRACYTEEDREQADEDAQR